MLLQNLRRSLLQLSGVFCCAFMMKVGCHDLLLRRGPRAVRAGDRGRAGFGVPGNISIFTGAGHCDRVN